MFKDLRKFVRMVDAVLQADKTRQKANEVFNCMQKRMDAEHNAHVQADEAAKEKAKFNSDLLISLVPQIVPVLQALFDDLLPKKHEIHIGRAPVVVDREEQGGDPERAQPEAPPAGATPPPDGKDLSNENMKIVEHAVLNIRKALGDLNSRVGAVETNSPQFAKQISDRFDKLEAMGSRFDLISSRLEKAEVMLGLAPNPAIAAPIPPAGSSAS